MGVFEPTREKLTKILLLTPEEKMYADVLDLLLQVFESEFGYFLLSELESVTNQLGLHVERDLSFREGKLTDVVPAPD